MCETHIAARPETVFAFFTDPEKMVRWKGARAHLDPRAGGVYSVDMNPTTRVRGTYLELQPPSRVVFTWGWADDDAHGLPPGSSTVEVTLTPDGEGTHVRLVHRGLTTLQMRETHRVGWDLYLPRLAIVASGGEAGPDPNAQSTNGGHIT